MPVPTSTEDFALEDRPLVGGGRRLAVRGPIDLYTAPEFKARLVSLIQAGEPEILLDLSLCSHMDSSGLGALLGAWRRLSMRGGRMAIVNTQDRLARLFKITGLVSLVAVFADAEQALAALREPGVR